MILRDASLYGRKGFFQLWIRDGKILSILDNASALPVRKDETVIDLEGALVLPGFINSHDHLDFNLYPQLGGKVFGDYTEWGPSIQHDHAETVKQIKNVPVHFRVAWGQYKNLLNGFTTVVNHGERLRIEQNIVHVYQDAQSLHSAAFEKKWKWKLNNPLRMRQRVAIHAGEGTTEQAVSEVEEIAQYNWLKRDIVAIHGVAMQKQVAGRFQGLVWCPASNYFLLGKTAEVEQLSEETSVVFGTDSTLTSPWNAWEHFRTALEHTRENNLLEMLTYRPASLWGMRQRGKIEANSIADLLILDYEKDVFENSPSTILAVMRNGRFMSVDEKFISLPLSMKNEMNLVQVGSSMKWVIGDLPGIINKIQQHFPFNNPLTYA